MNHEEIDIETFHERWKEGVLVVDVREPDEYEAGHVPGARLISLSEVAERADEVPVGETVYIICAMGGRSRKACEHLARLDRDVVNIAGGTMGWIESGLPTVPGTEPN